MEPGVQHRRECRFVSYVSNGPATSSRSAGPSRIDGRQRQQSLYIQDDFHVASSVTINVGETVTWTQRDVNTQHTVTADDNSFTSNNLSTGQTYPHTFSQAMNVPTDMTVVPHP